jgi:hypothetical protein
MRGKILLLIAAIFLLAFSISAQRTTTLFQKTYKVNKDSTSLSVAAIARANDGGYALLGNYQNSKNLGDMCVMRTDSLGSLVWTVNFNTDTTEAATGIRPTPDGGFVISGWNVSPIDYTKGDMLLAKIDATGNLKWATQFGDADADEAKDVAVLNNGDVMVVGSSYEGFNTRAYAILTKSTGLPENGQTVRFGTAPSVFSAIDKTFDGGAIATGYAGTVLQPTSYDPMLIKFNALGNVSWGKRFFTAGTQFNSTVRQTRDTGYILIGQQAVSQPNGQIPQTFYVIKTNSLGDTLWCKAYDTGKFEYAYSAADVGDGYIIAGKMKPGNIDTIRYRNAQGIDTFYLQEREAAFAMKIDPLGVFKWGKLYGDSTKITRFYSSVSALDGGVTLAGETFGYGNTSGAGFVVHTDKEGNMGAGTGCQIRNLAFTTTAFKLRDSSNVIVLDAGNQKVSNLRREAIAIIKSDICSGTGVNTPTADYHLPDNAVKLYPNPVNTQLFVEIDKNVLENRPILRGVLQR